MNQNSPLDSYIFNFPADFVPKEIEEKYKIFLDQYKKPFPLLLDYVNNNIKDIEMPSLSAPTVEQSKIYGKNRKFRGSKSPYDVYNRQLIVTYRNTDFHFSYFLMQELFHYHFAKNRKPFIGKFTVTILDSQRRELFNVYFDELIFTDLSSLRLGNQEKTHEESVVSLTFAFNYIDIEFIPKYATGAPEGELLDAFSDIILPHDDSISKTPPNENGDGTNGGVMGH